MKRLLLLTLAAVLAALLGHATASFAQTPGDELPPIETLAGVCEPTPPQPQEPAPPRGYRSGLVVERLRGPDRGLWRGLQ